MKIKGNIHKVINMNNYINSLKTSTILLLMQKVAIYTIILTMTK